MPVVDLVNGAPQADGNVVVLQVVGDGFVRGSLTQRVLFSRDLFGFRLGDVVGGGGCISS